MPTDIPPLVVLLAGFPGPDLKRLDDSLGQFAALQTEPIVVPRKELTHNGSVVRADLNVPVIQIAVPLLQGGAVGDIDGLALTALRTLVTLYDDILRKDTTNFGYLFVVSDEVPDSYLDDLLALRWRENLKIWTIQWDNDKRKDIPSKEL